MYFRRSTEQVENCHEGQARQSRNLYSAPVSRAECRYSQRPRASRLERRRVRSFSGWVCEMHRDRLERLAPTVASTRRYWSCGCSGIIRRGRRRRWRGPMFLPLDLPGSPKTAKPPKHCGASCPSAENTPPTNTTRTGYENPKGIRGTLLAVLKGLSFDVFVNTSHFVSGSRLRALSQDDLRVLSWEISGNDLVTVATGFLGKMVRPRSGQCAKK
jgi:hypothetical protein